MTMSRDELAKRLGAAGVAAEARDVCIEERDPQCFMARFADAVAAGGSVFLADPGWGSRERAQFNRITAGVAAGRRSSVEPSSLGDAARPAGVPPLQSGSGWLCIPTGGSSGTLKLARHDESTLWAAVHGFALHFGTPRVSAVGLLPLHHVSGLMAWLRCMLTGGEHLPWDWKRLEAGERPVPPAAPAFVSLVPTQLDRLLRQTAAVDWLRRFRAIVVGGGPAWPELVERSVAARLPLAFSYGTTETAAMAAALRPEEFFAGRRGCGSALPHGRITIEADGSISVESASLFRGYWPDGRPAGRWPTGDVGEFDASGSLHVHGRRDGLIISGGEKIDPVEVEEALRATGRLAEVAVVGVPDPQWGEVVVACHSAHGPPPDRRQVEEALAGRLVKFKWPRRYVAVDPWPENALGKVRRDQLVRAAAAQTGKPAEGGRA